MESPLQRNLEGYLKTNTLVQKDFKIIQLLQNNQQTYKLNWSPGQVGNEGVFEDEELKSMVYFEPKLVIENTLRHYEKIFIGILSNFFPENLDEAMVLRIRRFLELKEVSSYYRRHHKYFLPNGILAYCFAVENSLKNEYVGDLSDSGDFFSEFLVLDRSIKNKENVVAFLSIFDNYSSIDAGLVLTTLSTRDGIEKAFQPDSFEVPSIIKRATIGAFEFLSSLGQIQDLIHRANGRPILQSALWHYYGYYFDTMGVQLKGFYGEALGRLQSTLASQSVFPDFNTEKDSLVVRAIQLLAQAELTIDDMINNKTWAKPLQRVAQRHLEQFGVVRALV